MKRAFDFTVALIGLTVLSPLLLFVALLVRLTSVGPVFFRQERVGRGFRMFRILKFRTMVSNAAKLGGQITAGQDPRVTPVGRILRKTKIDELPQLVNVLKGDMSFVGPRPEVPRYVQLYRDEFAQLLAVRPGITDLASLKYRHEAELLGQSDDPEKMYVYTVLPDKIALGKQYVARASLITDVRIIIKTLFGLTM